MADEAKLLREYEKQLEQARHDVATLTPIVEGLRQRVSVENSEIQKAAVTTLWRAYAGRPTYEQQVVELLADGTERHVDDIVATLQANGQNEPGRPSYQSVVNRLSALVSAGMVVRPRRGIYARATSSSADGTDVG